MTAVRKPKKKGTLAEEMSVLQATFPEAPKRFEFLYSMLSIVDSKASSLMAFNAIGLAALAIWLEGLPLNWLHLTLDLVFLLFLFSSATCFIVVRVYWSPSAHFRDPELQMKTLLEKRDRRTQLYRTSWWLSVVAVGIFTVVSIVHAVGTSLRATGTCDVRCGKFYSEKVWGRRDSQQTENKGDR